MQVSRYPKIVLQSSAWYTDGNNLEMTEISSKTSMDICKAFFHFFFFFFKPKTYALSLFNLNEKLLLQKPAMLFAVA